MPLAIVGYQSLTTTLEVQQSGHFLRCFVLHLSPIHYTEVEKAKPVFHLQSRSVPLTEHSISLYCVPFAQQYRKVSYPKKIEYNCVITKKLCERLKGVCWKVALFLFAFVFCFGFFFSYQLTELSTYYYSTKMIFSAVFWWSYLPLESNHLIHLGWEGYYSSVEHIPCIKRVLCYAGTNIFNFILKFPHWEPAMAVQLANSNSLF